MSISIVQQLQQLLKYLIVLFNNIAIFMPRGSIMCPAQMSIFTVSHRCLTAYAYPHSARFLSSAPTECSFQGHFLNGYVLAQPLHEWSVVIDHLASGWFGVIDHFAGYIAFGAPGLFSQTFNTHLIRHIHNILFEAPCLLH